MHCHFATQSVGRHSRRHPSLSRTCQVPQDTRVHPVESVVDPSVSLLAAWVTSFQPIASNLKGTVYHRSTPAGGRARTVGQVQLRLAIPATFGTLVRSNPTIAATPHLLPSQTTYPCQHRTHPKWQDTGGNLTTFVFRVRSHLCAMVHAVAFPLLHWLLHGTNRQQQRRNPRHTRRNLPCPCDA